MTKQRQGPVPVSGVWLRTLGQVIQLLVEFDGHWHVVVEEKLPADGSDPRIGHIVEPLGIIGSPLDPLTSSSGEPEKHSYP